MRSTSPNSAAPKQASLAQALAHYATLSTITKGGYAAELDRINHYLVATASSHCKLCSKTLGDNSLSARRRSCPARSPLTRKAPVQNARRAKAGSVRRGKRKQPFSDHHAQTDRSARHRASPKSVTSAGPATGSLWIAVSTNRP